MQKFFFQFDKAFLADLRLNRFDDDVVYRARLVTKSNDAANASRIVDLMQTGFQIEVSENVPGKQMLHFRLTINLRLRCSLIFGNKVLQPQARRLLSARSSSRGLV